jgi:hypothetical protein
MVDVPAAVAQAPPDGEGISEAASENKPKRGRPRAWKTDGGYQLIRDTAPRVKTPRGQQERLYAGAAYRVLVPTEGGGTAQEAALERYRWLLGEFPLAEWHAGAQMIRDVVDPRRSSPGPKFSILAELGRIVFTVPGGREHARAIADELCTIEPKLTVKRAAAMVREWRLGERKAFTEQEVLERLATTVDNLKRASPATSTATIVAAVDRLLTIMEDIHERETGTVQDDA